MIKYSHGAAGPVAKVENIKTKEKFTVSTARNPYGIYETVVFRASNSFISVINAFTGKALFIVNSPTLKQAEQNHIRTTELFEQLNPKDMIRKYKIEGRAGAQLLMSNEAEVTAFEDTVTKSDKLSPENLIRGLKISEEHKLYPSIERHAQIDIAYPANEKEYCALGSYSFAKVAAISEHSEELPIERAYFQLSKGKIMPLESLEISVDDKPNFTNKVIETKDDKDRTYFKSFSFWAIPTGFFQYQDGLIAIDFKDERKNFVLLRGPWKLNNRICEWVQKHTSGEIQVAEHVASDLIANFIQREFGTKRA